MTEMVFLFGENTEQMSTEIQFELAFMLEKSG